MIDKKYGHNWTDDVPDDALNDGVNAHCFFSKTKKKKENQPFYLKKAQTEKPGFS